MKKLLEFLLAGILGEKKFTVAETDDGDFSHLTIKTLPENLGLIIGKKGNTIKTLRNILRIKATLEKKVFSLDLEE